MPKIKKNKIEQCSKIFIYRDLTLIIFIQKTEVMNKGKSFFCALISERIRLLKYVSYVLAFKTFFARATAFLATIPLITRLLLSILARSSC